MGPVVVGSARRCLPRHPTYFQPSFLECSGILSCDSTSNMWPAICGEHHMWRAIHVGGPAVGGGDGGAARGARRTALATSVTRR